MGKNELSVKQENFCHFYIETGNASEAYRCAFNADNMKAESVAVEASKLLSNPNVALMVQELRNELIKCHDITKERILSELKAILGAKITDYLDFDGTNISFKDFKTLSEDKIKAIESIKEGKNGIELKLHGKSWTIDRICKMLGYDTPQRHEHTGENGGPIEHQITEHKITFEDYEE